MTDLPQPFRRAYKLTAKEKEALRFHIEGKSTDEIADLQGVVRGSVYMRLQTARDKIGGATLAQAVAMVKHYKIPLEP